MIGFQPNRFWRICWAFVTPTILTVFLFFCSSHPLTHTHTDTLTCFHLHCRLSTSLICNWKGTGEKLLLLHWNRKLFPPPNSCHVTKSQVVCVFKSSYRDIRSAAANTHIHFQRTHSLSNGHLFVICCVAEAVNSSAHGLTACQCWTLASVNDSNCNGNHCSSKAEVTMTNGAAVEPAGHLAALEGDLISSGSSLMHNPRLIYGVCFPVLCPILILLSQMCCR